MFGLVNVARAMPYEIMNVHTTPTTVLFLSFNQTLGGAIFLCNTEFIFTLTWENDTDRQASDNNRTT